MNMYKKINKSIGIIMNYYIWKEEEKKRKKNTTFFVFLYTHTQYTLTHNNHNNR